MGKLFLGMILGAMIAIMMADGPATADLITHNILKRFQGPILGDESNPWNVIIVAGIVLVLLKRVFGKSSGHKS